MTDAATNAEDRYVRAVWLIEHLAQRVRVRPNGIAVVFLPTSYVDLIRDIAETPLSTPPADPTSTAKPAPWLGVCGAVGCGYNDEWEAQAPGSPCPACGNELGNKYQRVADLLDAGQQTAFGPPIDTYTRAAALADGQLVDVTLFGKEAGLRYPVAMTIAAWNETVAWPEGDRDHQSDRRRLWEVVTSAVEAVRQGGGDAFDFAAEVSVGRHSTRRVQLRCVWGPGDDGHIVGTIMVPGESR
jgi:hypothetical protein